MSAIKAQQLSYIYNRGTPSERVALDGVSLEIGYGEIVGIIGHTGSGKSTLIQHFNGLLQPTAGKVFVDGKDLSSDKEILRKARFQVGLVFQYPEYQLFEETVYKDIAFGPKNMGLDEGEVHRRVMEAAKFVSLSEELLQKSPFELSGGQKRRAAIAGVIAMEPSVLVLDEPAAGLDPKGRDRILSQIKEYRSADRTVVLVSHSMEDIAKTADRVLVMNQGKIFDFDRTQRIFERSAELTEMGLEVPEVTKVFLTLSERGIPVRTGIYTVEDGVRELGRLFASGRDGDA